MLRTWRLPVLGGVVLFFALTGPVLALLTPELLRSMQSSAPGVVIRVPDPTWRDAYAQWIKNLTQIVSFVAIIAAAGSVAGEVASGTALLVLTKPVSRSCVRRHQGLALFGLLAATVLAGTLVTQLVTFAVFGTAPAGALWLPTFAWLWLRGPARLDRRAAVVDPPHACGGRSRGRGLLRAVACSALGTARAVHPGRPGRRPRSSARGRDGVRSVWPILTTAIACAAVVALAAALFARREL